MNSDEKSSSLLRIFFRQYARNRLAITAAIVLAFLFLAAIVGPLLTRFDPDEIHLDEIYQRPSLGHFFGTDMNGRDVFVRVLYGARISMSVGFISSGLAGIIGVLIGALAGFFGGKIDSLLMRLVDLILSIPSFFLLLMVIAMLEPNIYNVMIVIALTSWPGLARMVRAEVLSVRERDYIQAAIALGIGRWRIIWRHIIPNVMAPVFVAVTLGVASAILIESGLSFLGLGVQPPTPSWGNILAQGRSVMQFAWWMTVFPGLAIFITVLCYNLVGEGLRDALDPRLRR
ncbi:MAG: ABC transporter permease [Calditrichaeota bacterium]|nr:ABC transporter permease [Calditrichota bacterium]